MEIFIKGITLIVKNKVKELTFFLMEQLMKVILPMISLMVMVKLLILIAINIKGNF